MQQSPSSFQRNRIQLREFEDGYRVCLGIGYYAVPYPIEKAMELARVHAQKYRIPVVDVCDADGGIQRVVPCFAN